MAAKSGLICRVWVGSAVGQYSRLRFGDNAEPQYCIPSSGSQNLNLHEASRGDSRGQLASLRCTPHSKLLVISII
jgi:hypothetical protein